MIFASWYAPPFELFSLSQSSKKSSILFLKCVATSGFKPFLFINKITVFVPVFPKVWLPSSTIDTKSKYLRVEKSEDEIKFSYGSQYLSNAEIKWNFKKKVLKMMKIFLFQIQLFCWKKM